MDAQDTVDTVRAAASRQLDWCPFIFRMVFRQLATPKNTGVRLLGPDSSWFPSDTPSATTPLFAGISTHIPHWALSWQLALGTIASQSGHPGGRAGLWKDGADATEASPVLPRGVLVPGGHLPSSRDVKETNFVLRLGAREVIQRFISLLGQGRGQMPQPQSNGHHRGVASSVQQARSSVLSLAQGSSRTGAQQSARGWGARQNLPVHFTKSAGEGEPCANPKVNS